MAKDRNTFAKRQREVEKKRKAGEKRERRAKEKQKADEPNESHSVLSAAERTVLRVFHDDQMTVGKAIIFNSADLEGFKIPLFQLTNKGLLIAEKDQGAYALTETGFAEMQDGE